MDWPAFVLVEEGPGGVYLYRLTKSGDVVGDTWHASESDAKRQAAIEYGDLLGSWRDVPEEARDEELPLWVLDDSAKE